MPPWELGWRLWNRGLPIPVSAPLWRLSPLQSLTAKATAVLSNEGSEPEPWESLSEPGCLAASPLDLFFNLKEEYTGYVCIS